MSILNLVCLLACRETGFPEDLSSTDFVKNDIIDIVSYGVIARNADTKEVVGYNGLSCLEPTSKSVRAIGPLAVTTKAQGKYVNLVAHFLPACLFESPATERLFFSHEKEAQAEN
jgi:hypothetical protein